MGREYSLSFHFYTCRPTQDDKWNMMSYYFSGIFVFKYTFFYKKLMFVCVCVCVCREREREREGGGELTVSAMT